MKRRKFLKSGAALMASTVSGLTAVPSAAAASPAHPVTAGDAPPQPGPSRPSYRLPEGDPGFLPKLPVPADSLRTRHPSITAMPLSERVKPGVLPRRGFCSTAPGQAFTDTLLSGSGPVIAELTGDPYGERMLWHHERLLLPWKRPFEAPDVASVLPEVRKLLLAGKYREGLDRAYDAMSAAGLPMNTKAHATIPACSVRVTQTATDTVRHYLRTLNFETGEASVMWTDANGSWLRRMFVSRPDDLIVQQLQHSGGAVDAEFVLEPPAIGPHTGPVTFAQSAEEHRLTLTGRFDPAVNRNGYAVVVRIVPVGGTLHVQGDRLAVRDAQSVLLLARIAWFAEFSEAQVTALAARLDAVAADYDALLARHRPVQAETIGRVSLELGGAQDHAKSVEELLQDQRTGVGYSAALLEKIFDMGRYWLMLSCGEFPVQPMAGEVNININLQVSHGILANLPEAMAPYFNWIESLLPDCRNNARNIFGARGVVYPILPNKDMGVSFLYASTVNQGIWPHPYWISAGGWCYSPFWDHYLVTGDKEFLRKRVLPGLKELALFYEDFLTVKDERGNFVFVPSFSPENWPEHAEPLPPANWPLSAGGFDMTPPTPLVINAAMDVMVCRDVLTHLVEAASILATEQENVPRWREMLARMPPYLTTADGTLKEWGWPGLEENYDQRHVSHLYGAWPADEIDPGRTPELARAALLADRKRGPANSSAHGLCHRALAGARLKDSYLVDFELRQLLQQGYFGNTLRSSHNPYRAPMPDAQGGVPSILMEMLCYARPGVIELLPALPPTLRKGTIQGMLLRTFARLETMSWDLDTLEQELTLWSLRPQRVTLVAWFGLAGIAGPDAHRAGSRSPDGMSCVVDLPEGRTALRIRLASSAKHSWVGQL